MSGVDLVEQGVNIKNLYQMPESVNYPLGKISFEDCTNYIGILDLELSLLFPEISNYDEAKNQALSLAASYSGLNVVNDVINPDKEISISRYAELLTHLKVLGQDDIFSKTPQIKQLAAQYLDELKEKFIYNQTDSSNYISSLVKFNIAFPDLDYSWFKNWYENKNNYIKKVEPHKNSNINNLLLIAYLKMLNPDIYENINLTETELYVWGVGFIEKSPASSTQIFQLINTSFALKVMESEINKNNNGLIELKSLKIIPKVNNLPIPTERSFV